MSKPKTQPKTTKPAAPVAPMVRTSLDVRHHYGDRTVQQWVSEATMEDIATAIADDIRAAKHSKTDYMQTLARFNGSGIFARGSDSFSCCVVAKDYAVVPQHPLGDLMVGLTVRVKTFVSGFDPVNRNHLRCRIFVTNEDSGYEREVHAKRGVLNYAMLAEAMVNVARVAATSHAENRKKQEAAAAARQTEAVFVDEVLSVDAQLRKQFGLTVTISDPIEKTVRVSGVVKFDTLLDLIKQKKGDTK